MLEVLPDAIKDIGVIILYSIVGVLVSLGIFKRHRFELDDQTAFMFCYFTVCWPLSLVLFVLPKGDFND